MYNLVNNSPRPLWQHKHTWGCSVLLEDFMPGKDFKTIEEQIEILSSRGLSIQDIPLAKDFLMHNNYYRISGYSLTLRDHDVFSKNATFQNIVDIYCFDHELRHILLSYIEIIEVTIKSVYSYEFTRVHGGTGYLNSQYFTDETKYHEIMAKAEAQKAKRLQNEAFLKHFVLELKIDIPLWAYVELLTISDISFLYSISELQIAQSVARELGFSNNKGVQILSSFLHRMTIIRNLCAHGGRLFNRFFEQKPWLNKKELSLLPKDKNGEIDNSHLYSFMFIMKRLLKDSDFAQLKSDLIHLTQKYPFVRMDYYGFRQDWKTVL